MDAGAVLRYENETNIKTDKHKKKTGTQSANKIIKYLRNLVNISKTLAVKNLWELSNLI